MYARQHHRPAFTVGQLASSTLRYTPLLFCLALCACLLGFALAVRLPASRTFTVTTTADSGAGSLRQAMLDANAAAGADLIRFQIAPGGAQTITPLSPLPPLTDSVTLDGTTQGGYAGHPLVEIEGSELGGENPDGLLVAAPSCTLRGLILNRFGRTAVVFGDNSDNSVLEQCLVGTDFAGTKPLANSLGVLIAQTSGVTLRDCTLSGNGIGVRIENDAQDSVIEHNIIGLDISGSTPLGNDEGIVVEGGADAVIEGNVIAGNALFGISLRGTSVRSTVQNNSIGISRSFEIIPSGLAGVEIASSAENKLLDNLIVGHLWAGVLLQGNSAQRNRMEGNLLALNAYGVDLRGGAQNNFLGGADQSPPNVIEGSIVDGVTLSGEGTRANMVQRNELSGNGGSGVAVFSDDNHILGNRIFANGIDGVRVGAGENGPFAERVAIRANSIRDNGDLGIRLETAQMLGANRLQPAPTLLAVGSEANGTVVFGSLHAAPNTRYEIEVFANAEPDPSGRGEGERLLTTLAVTTNATGSASIAAGGLPNTLRDQFLSATATDPEGNTSAFSNALRVGDPVPAPVITSLDPTEAEVGSETRTLIVRGANFVSGARVRWNDAPRTTRFMSAQELRADLPASDFARAGSAQITVTNPDGAISNVVYFTVVNPRPTLTAVEPEEALAGSNLAALTVRGTKFVDGAKVRWNGANRTTTFVSATELRATLLPGDTAEAGSFPITVVNPEPGGGASNALTFRVTNPVPALTSVSPDTALAGTPGLTLTLNGSQFVRTSEVRWNGARRTTTYVSSTRLTAALTATDLAQAGTGQITVFNPAPGGGTSNALTFTVQPTPDVQVTAHRIPEEAWSDRAFEVAWTDTNAGQATAAGPWVDRIYLSDDDQFGGDTPVSDPIGFEGSLAAGQSVERIHEITIPRNRIPEDRTYYLIFVTDAANNVNEFFREGNNIRIVPITLRRLRLPDLKVESLEAPETAFAGNSVTVRWTVQNAGDGATDASEWTDWVYVSADNVPDVDDPIRVPVQNVSYLNAGERYTSSVTLSIPKPLIGSYKILVYTDFNGSNNLGGRMAVEESDERNNWDKVHSITLQAPPLPDLRVKAVRAPDTAFANETIAVGWTVKNDAMDADTAPDESAWEDAVYLSEDALFSPATDRLLGVRAHTGGLARNAEYAVNDFAVRLPNNVRGQWFVLIVTDHRNQVFEYVGEGNNVGVRRNAQEEPVPLSITNTPPNLAVEEALTAPETATAGHSITVSWRVKNVGAFAAQPPWFDTVYLSQDSTLDPATDTALASVPHTDVLEANASYETPASATVTLPACQSGTYYLFVRTDSLRQVFEFDPTRDAEADNDSQAKAVAITRRSPDLQVNSVLVPATANAGQTVAMTWTTANAGTGPTQQNEWTERVYLSPTETFDPATATAIGSFGRDAGLDAGQNDRRTEQVTLPVTAHGTYWVFVWTDADDTVEECENENNNRARAATQIAVTNNLPDLTIPVSLNAPASALSGRIITVGWTGQNEGMAAIGNAAWNDLVYFSRDNQLDSSDRLLARSLIRGPLPIGGTYNALAQVQLPIVEEDTYFLIVKADGDGFVFEGQGETNNVRVQAIAMARPNVDLQVTATDAPATAVSGQEMSISWTVRNAGSVATFPAAWTDYVILSRDQVYDASDVQIGWRTHSGILDGGASYIATLACAVPAGLTGPYYVFVRTDWHNQVAETFAGEFNNVGEPDGVQITLPPPVDLTVTAVTPAVSGAPGETATLRWTGRNAGQNALAGRWRDAVYFSKDRQWDSGDTLVGRVDFAQSLAAGAQYNGVLETELPAVEPDNYFVIVRTDVRNQIRESDETNNITASSATMRVDVPELPLGQTRRSTLRTNKERYFRTENVPANETLLYTLTPDRNDVDTELYARYARIPSLAAFDFLYSRPYEAYQEITVPSTLAGRYYTLTRAAFLPPGLTDAFFNISAEIVPFSIRSVSPARIGDNGQVTITIRGAKFADGATVQLVRVGAATLTAARVWKTDNATLKARFFFTNAAHGAYDVVVSNPDGNTSIAEQATTIETSTGYLPAVTMITERQPRTGRDDYSFATVRNTGNIDLTYMSVRMFAGKAVTMQVIAPLNVMLEMDGIRDGRGYVEGTEMYGKTRALFFARDLAPGDSFDFQVRLSNLTPGHFKFEADVTVMRAMEMAAMVRGWIEEDRQLLLRNNTDVHPQLQAVLHSSTLYWNTVANALVEGGVFYPEDIPSGGLLPANVGPGHCGCKDPNVYTRTCALKGPFGYAKCLWKENAKCILPALGGGCECEEGDPNCKEPRNPGDPNDKVGPAGYGPQAFVGNQQPLPYTINFENVPTATAWAQRIVITDELESDLDWRTFRLREIGFGNYRIPVPENRASFRTRLPLGEDLGNLTAEVSAGIDIATGKVTWTLTALDPRTGEQPTGALQGLLPPNDENGMGQGFVTYTIQPRSDRPTGTALTNNATIIFDSEEPIVTNMVANTLDADAPTSAVLPLPPTSDARFQISWAGFDPADGSGLQSYDVWVSEDFGSSRPLLTGTTETRMEFVGDPGKTYQFYSRARDNAGNIEPIPTQPDAETSINVRAVSVAGRIQLQGCNAVDHPITLTFRLLNGAVAFTRTVTPAADGTFRLENVPGRRYRLSAKGAKWLQQTVAIDGTTGDVNGISLTLPGGDANDDNTANISDLMILIAAYNSQRGVDAEFRDVADFNCDGFNDIADLLLLIGNYNRQGDR
jgi:parallel beta-helix repeat protein